MGRALWLLPIEMMALVASATRFDSRSLPTQTTYDATQTTLMEKPSPEPTAEIGVMELFARQDTYSASPGTCGFGGSDRPWVTYTCFDSDAICQTIADYYGCCVGGTSSCLQTIVTACENYQTSTTCGDWYHTRCCDATFPYCLTYLFEDDKTIFDCEASLTSTPVTMLATPWDWLVEHSMTDQVSSSPSTSSTSSSSTTTSDTATAATESSTQSSSSGGGSNSNSSDNTGAIVGGVIGGVAVLALIGLGIFFMRRYFSKRDGAAAAGAGAGGPGGDPNYNANTAYMGGAGGAPAEIDSSGHPTTIGSPSTGYAAATPQTYYSNATSPGGMPMPQQQMGQVPQPYPGYGAPQPQEYYNGGYAKPGYAGGYAPVPMAEAPADAPLGHEYNRAELGHGPGHTAAEMQ